MKFSKIISQPIHVILKLSCVFSVILTLLYYKPFYCVGSPYSVWLLKRNHILYSWFVHPGEIAIKNNILFLFQKIRTVNGKQESILSGWNTHDSARAPELTTGNMRAWIYSSSFRLKIPSKQIEKEKLRPCICH